MKNAPTTTTNADGRHVKLANPETAAQAYTANANAIWKACEAIRTGLIKHSQEQAKDAKNWCMVGDLGHMKELLERAASFINGTEE